MPLGNGMWNAVSKPSRSFAGRDLSCDRRKVCEGISVAWLSVPAGAGQRATRATYDISTLAGKVVSVNGTDGLQIRMSAFLQEEAEDFGASQTPAAPIAPSFVLSSPLDGTTVLPPAVTVNQDTAAAP